MKVTRENGARRRAAIRGVFAAMAMTGMRRMTTGLGLVREPPPDAILRQGFPSLFALIPVENRDEAIELAHWAYGGLAGAAFAALPRRLRRGSWAGPLYGVGIWAVFETGVVPLVFGPGFAARPRVRERLALAADHVLYGLVVAGGAGAAQATRAPRP